MYSSGNIDVRNWDHLFESPCIITFKATCFNSIESSSGLPKNRSSVSTFTVHSGIPKAYNRWYSQYKSTHVSQSSLWLVYFYIDCTTYYKPDCVCSLWFINPCGDRPLSRLGSHPARSPHGYINQRLQTQFGASDDERYAARNMLRLQ